MQMKTTFYTQGDKVRVIDKAYTNNALVWNRDLFVAWETEAHVHVVDNLDFPVFINYFLKTQVIKVSNGQKEKVYSGRKNSTRGELY